MFLFKVFADDSEHSCTWKNYPTQTIITGKYTQSHDTGIVQRKKSYTSKNVLLLIIIIIIIRTTTATMVSFSAGSRILGIKQHCFCEFAREQKRCRSFLNRFRIKLSTNIVPTRTRIYNICKCQRRRSLQKKHNIPSSQSCVNTRAYKELNNIQLQHHTSTYI